MNREYFNSVEFPELEPKPEPEPADATDPATEVEWDGILTEVRRMIAAVKSGESNIIRRAVDLNNAPINKTLKALAERPSTPTMVEFLKIAEQDINVRFRRECVLLFKQNSKLKELMEGRNIE
jgi:hypothetical protein